MTDHGHFARIRIAITLDLLRGVRVLGFILRDDRPVRSRASARHVDRFAGNRDHLPRGFESFSVRCKVDQPRTGGLTKTARPAV